MPAGRDPRRGRFPELSWSCRMVHVGRVAAARQPGGRGSGSADGADNRAGRRKPGPYERRRAVLCEGYRFGERRPRSFDPHRFIYDLAGLADHRPRRGGGWRSRPPDRRPSWACSSRSPRFRRGELAWPWSSVVSTTRQDQPSSSSSTSPASSPPGTWYCSHAATPGYQMTGPADMTQPPERQACRQGSSQRPGKSQ